MAGNPDDGEDKGGISIWIPIGIVGGVLVIAGAAFLVLWKLKKLPWVKE